MTADLERLGRLAYLAVGCPDTLALIHDAMREVRELRGEVDRLHSRVHDLEAEVMKAVGELVIEVGRRMAAERKLEAMEANASAPAAIVIAYYEDRQQATFAFADADDALRFCRTQDVAAMVRTPDWSWHPPESSVNVDTAINASP